MDKELINSHDNTYGKVRETVLTAKNKVYVAINFAMVEAYWEIGKEIFEAQGKSERAEYGKGLLEYLAKGLTSEFGKGFTVANLRNMRQFYTVFENRYTLCSELSWSHYRLLMRIDVLNDYIDKNLVLLKIKIDELPKEFKASWDKLNMLFFSVVE